MDTWSQWVFFYIPGATLVTWSLVFSILRILTGGVETPPGWGMVVGSLGLCQIGIGKLLGGGG